MSGDFIEMMWRRTLFLGDVLKHGYNFIFTRRKDGGCLGAARQRRSSNVWRCKALVAVEAKETVATGGGELVFMDEVFADFDFDFETQKVGFVNFDTDVMWLRNPLSRLVLNETLDLQISTDKFNGNESSGDNLINTGFYMTRSNIIALFDSWYAKKDNSIGMKEQDVLQALMNEPVFTDLDLNVRFLNLPYIFRWILPRR
ncbi:hypothetical protein RHMOL_Rhmol09G0246800 [Rhododendron molle]|uniref:Uncharacterized protein n=1 Tax=Rhododendron molle TaxID=49168 RepID=A0ACC0MGT2_RHOML|nr:hypothetical protein RHMOL_Rhmol09G0246800 [Rhododendron molle]